MSIAQDEVARAMPAIRTAFEGLKDMLRDGRMQAACQSLFGVAVHWGDELKAIYRDEGRDELSFRDPLTRFFVLRYRGMQMPADLAGAPPEAAFLMAFTAFPYLDALVEETVVGEHAGFDEDGNYMVRRVLAGEPDGLMRAGQGPRGWRFDLMPVYHAKGQALEDFVGRSYGGDFDLFFQSYLADIDIDFDLDRAWLPAGGRR